MPRTISLSSKENWGSQSVDRAPLVLLEVTHPQLDVPARIVAGNDNVVLSGNTFQAMGIEVILPDDGEQGLPSARISVPNVGHELMQWLELSGGRGAKVNLMLCSWVENAENVIEPTVEWNTVLRVSGITANAQRVTFDLGYHDLLSLPAVATKYDPKTSPGLHS